MDNLKPTSLSALMARYSRRGAEEHYRAGLLSQSDYDILVEAYALWHDYTNVQTWLDFRFKLYWRLRHGYVDQDQHDEILAVVGPWFRLLTI